MMIMMKLKATMKNMICLGKSRKMNRQMKCMTWKQRQRQLTQRPMKTQMPPTAVNKKQDTKIIDYQPLILIYFVYFTLFSGFQ